MIRYYFKAIVVASRKEVYVEIDMHKAFRLRILFRQSNLIGVLFLSGVVVSENLLGSS